MKLQSFRNARMTRRHRYSHATSAREQIFIVRSNECNFRKQCLDEIDDVDR